MCAPKHFLKTTSFALLMFLGWSQIGLIDTVEWPSVPIAVKSPYLSTWTVGPHIAHNFLNFWNVASLKPLRLYVRVDKTTYLVAPVGNVTWQTGLKVTPTQTMFNVTTGPVIVTLNFFSPIDANDLKRFSLPVSYLAVSTRSTDNQTRPVQICLSWSSEWVSGDENRTVRWDYQQFGSLFRLSLEETDPKPLTEYKDGPLWGSFHVFTNAIGTSFLIDKFSVIKEIFEKEGRVYNTIDSNFRPINDNWPVVAFAKEMYAGPLPSPNAFFVMARTAKPAVNTTEGVKNHLWEDFFRGNDREMMKFAFHDAENALARCNALDAKILYDAEQEGGQSYAKLVSAALRQAYGGLEFVGTQNRTWAVMKDLSASGACQRVDLLYANMPVHLYFNPLILKYLLEPLFVYQEKGLFTEDYAASDLGASYPHCLGGQDRTMGIEQTANMVIMADAYVRASNDTKFARNHYTILIKWTEYLLANGLYPGLVLTTDDFYGSIANSTNLSLKAIIAIAAMSDIADIAENLDDARRYKAIALNYFGTWRKLSEDPKSTHIKFSYNDQGTDSWVLLYNLYADVLLGTHLVPKDIVADLEIWYLSHGEKYGVPLRNGAPYTKADWLLFTAASSPSRSFRQSMYDRVALFLSDDTLHYAFRDRFGTTNTSTLYEGSFARPTVGAVFAPMIVHGFTPFDERDLFRTFSPF